MVNWELQEGKYVRDPRLGHRFGINFKGRFESSGSSVNTYQLATDNYGFIHNGFNERRENLDRKEGYERIIIVGGSLAMGMGATANHLTIAAQLENILNNEYGHKSEVINAACGGYCSWHTLIKLSMELIKLQPTTIIDISGWNDMMHSSWGSKNDGTWIENHDRSIEDVVIAILSLQGKLSLKKFISSKIMLSKSLLYLKKMCLKIFGRDYSTQDITWGHEKNTLVYRKKGIENYIRNLKSTNGICLAHKVRFIHILQPNPIWLNNNFRSEKDIISNDINMHLERYKNLSDLSSKYLSQLKVWYQKENDLNIKEYSDLAKNELFVNEDWVDHCHLSNEGQLKLANFIVKNYYELNAK